jgi:ribonuclease-3
VWRWWEPFLNLDQPAQRDAKTLLQEYAQSRRLGLPRYRTVSKTGPDHSPHFIVEVAIQGEGPVLGEGSSQKIAQQAAAGALLTKLGAWERCVELEESHE